MLNKVYETTVVCKGLSGTMAIPQTNKTKYPAVLIVAGSGQLDRNGNFKKIKLDTNLYKNLAELITNQGYISLRYDKRGVGESKGNFFKTGMWDLVKDVNSWIVYLQNHPQVDSNKIVVLGHSEGCTLITAAYVLYPVKGLIMLAGAGETLPEALKCQRKLLYSEMLNLKGFKGFLMRKLKIDKIGERQADRFINKILNSEKSTFKYLFTRVNAKWYQEHFRYDLYSDLKKVYCPVLAVTGSKDVQANPNRLNHFTDFISGDAVCIIIEEMDHGLKEYTGKKSILNNKAQYKSSSISAIHPELKKILINWLINFAKEL